MLKNNYFEFESKITQQISGTAIGTKFAPPYACLFMDRIENDFFDSEVVKPWLWLRYMDDMFFIWTEGEDKPEGLLNRLDNFHPNLKLTHEKNKSSVSFLGVSVIIVDNKLKTDLLCKPTDSNQFPNFYSAHLLLFCSGCSLRNHLVRAKVYPLIREKGTFSCGKSKCKTCCNIKQTYTCESFVTKNVYKTNRSFNCDNKGLIYLFSCKVYGFTVDRFRLRWNNYKSCQRNAADGGTPNQNYSQQHFLSDGQFS